MSIEFQSLPKVTLKNDWMILYIHKGFSTFCYSGTPKLKIISEIWHFTYSLELLGYPRCTRTLGWEPLLYTHPGQEIRVIFNPNKTNWVSSSNGLWFWSTIHSHSMYSTVLVQENVSTFHKVYPPICWITAHNSDRQLNGYQM